MADKSELPTKISYQRAGEDLDHDVDLGKATLLELADAQKYLKELLAEMPQRQLELKAVNAAIRARGK